MKQFVDNYIAVPFAILVFCFLAPLVGMSGLIFTAHVFKFLPDSGFCNPVKK